MYYTKVQLIKLYIKDKSKFKSYDSVNGNSNPVITVPNGAYDRSPFYNSCSLLDSELAFSIHVQA